MGNSFSGFTPESLGFLESLAANNKVWFDDHRDEFEQYLMEPLKNLVSDQCAGNQREMARHKNILQINDAITNMRVCIVTDFFQLVYSA